MSLIYFLPLMKYYYDGGAFNEIDNKLLPFNMGNFVSPFSLGNLGHAKTKCFHQYIVNDLPYLHKCETGLISDLKHYGLMPSIILEGKEKRKKEIEKDDT